MDYLTDPVPLPLFRLAETASMFPDYVAGQSWPDQAEVLSLRKQAFADPKSREFPLHTKQAVWLAAAYVSAAPAYEREVRPGVADAIKQAAARFDITPDVEAIMEFQTQACKAAAHTPDTYALRTGEVLSYPLGTRYDVDMSALGIQTDFRNGRLPVKQARMASLALVKRAAQLKVDTALLATQAVTLGSDKVADPDMLKRAADWRARQAPCDLYKIAAESFLEQPTEARRCELAQLWIDLDAATGVKESATTLPVIDIIFGGVSLAELQKVASQTILIQGKAVPAGMLASIPDEAITSWFNADLQTKVAAVVSAARRDGMEASQLLESFTPDEVQMLSGRVAAFHEARLAS